jgi:CheY-like chemotaxis protein
VIGPRSRILIVDDNITSLKLVSVLLADGGYDLRAAVTGEEALVLVRSFRPHLVLVDLQLPDIDVLDLTRRLKAEAAVREVVIVAVTTEAPPGDQEDARDIDVAVEGYITKPLEPRRFRNAVASYLAG